MIAPSSRHWPRIVAESLAHVREPIATLVAPAVPASTAEVLAALATAITPGRAPLSPPAFLHLHQIDSWRRALHAVSRYGGAVIAEPTGSGKSWIALGLAAMETARPLVIAPAVLLPQWSATSAHAGVPTQLWSQERISRGVLPPRTGGLVIIDEAHRLRDSATRRVQTIAPWLVNRRVVLLTATPIVNRLRDLIALLRLIVAEDALALDGVVALGDLEQAVLPPPGLRRLLVRSDRRVEHAARTVHRLHPEGHELARGERAVVTIGRLSLSRNHPIRRLLRSVLLDAAASSDAALELALRRYRALLLHARDGGGISRAAVRRFAGESLDQLVFWELTGSDHDSELMLEDIEVVEAILSRARAGADDGWIEQLRRELEPREIVVCFTRHRATAECLRQSFGEATAWVTGSAAGIGPHRLPRTTVLEAFGPARPQWCARRHPPRLLVATDVAAEGLDLQAADCIVHADLPWTAMRMAQREGRLLRLGQHHARVHIVLRLPPPAIERELAGRRRIRRKRTVSERWLAAMRRTDPADATLPRAPLVRTIDDGGVDASVVVIATARGNREGCWVIARTGEGGWTAELRTVTSLIVRAQKHRDQTDNTVAPGASTELADALRFVLATAATRPAATPVLIARIQRLARGAAARRDATALASLDRLLRFGVTPQSLGGRLLLERAGSLPDRELLRVVVPDQPRLYPVSVRVLAALLFRSGASRLR